MQVRTEQSRNQWLGKAVSDGAMANRPRQSRHECSDEEFWDHTMCYLEVATR